MKNEILEIISIIFLMFVGSLVVVGDIKHKKIKNRFILLGFFGGSVIFLFGFLFGFIQLVYLRDVLINFFIALVVSYLFWLASFWPAGDAKLFSLFAFLLPLHYYRKSYLPFFPSITLLANVFIFAYAFLFVRSLFHFASLFFKRDAFILNLLKTVFLPGNPAFIFKKINLLIMGRGATVMVVVFVLVNYVQKLGNKRDFHISYGVAVGSLLAWLMASFIVKKYIADRESYPQKIESLKVGYSPLITLRDRDLFSKGFMKKLGPLKAEGLDEDQVSLIKKMLEAKKINFINIQKDEPFSPWIVAGLLSTMAFNENIMQALGRLFFRG
ncbi:MAG: hypothetical protein HGA61_04160 [Candidatus Moranbacteria bacterium]|nr:hypothetical protein [Candidatus Moranbacteria bacterium]